MRLAILLAVVIAGCRSAPPVVESPRPRVVSLLPNATEILFAMGLGPHVVGVTRYCVRPEEARRVPRVGGILDVSTEAVLALKPDVVVGSPTVLTGRFRVLLEASGARVLPLSFETPSSIVLGTRAMGEAMGEPEAASRLADSMATGLSALAGALKADPPIRILFVAGRNPIVVAGPSSFLGALLDEMGAINVVEAGSVTFPTWSLEQVIRADPDVVVDGSVDTDNDFAGVLAPAGVRAARLGRVVRVPDEGVIRPGPATVDAAMRLAEAVRIAVEAHP